MYEVYCKISNKDGLACLTSVTRPKCCLGLDLFGEQKPKTLLRTQKLDSRYLKRLVDKVELK